MMSHLSYATAVQASIRNTQTPMQIAEIVFWKKQNTKVVHEIKIDRHCDLGRTVVEHLAVLNFLV